MTESIRESLGPPPPKALHRLRSPIDRPWLTGTVVAMMATGCGSASIELLTLPAAKIVMQAPPPPPPAAVEPSTVTVTESKVEFDQKIAFESWKAELLEESTSILDDIAQVLQNHPSILRIEIQGHTAEDRNPRRLVLLSKQRAEAVRQYLVEKGVDASRLIARGYGSTKPIADNSSPEGREQNRRVEFIILERAKTDSMVAADGGGAE